MLMSNINVGMISIKPVNNVALACLYSELWLSKIVSSYCGSNKPTIQQFCISVLMSTCNLEVVHSVNITS
jgi:hypothetical protein